MILNHAVGIGQSRLALAQRLDFGASEHNARSESLKNLVVKGCLTVLDVDIVAMLFIVLSHSIQI